MQALDTASTAKGGVQASFSYADTTCGVTFSYADTTNPRFPLPIPPMETLHPHPGVGHGIHGQGGGLFSIDNLLVRIRCIIAMIRWGGLAPWEFDFPFPGSLTFTFLTLTPFHRQRQDFAKINLCANRNFRENRNFF